MLSESPFNYKGRTLRPSNVLKAIERRAVNIRKLLRSTQKPSDQRVWKEKDNAVKLAVTIEAVASQAVNLPAADATDSVDLLEIMLEELDQKLTRILAS
jgi:hypothetical protein